MAENSTCDVLPALLPRGTASICHVSRDGGSREIHFSREAVSELLANGSFFWLDLDRPGLDDFEILRDTFEFHPLAVEDSEHFEQRAKIASAPHLARVRWRVDRLGPQPASWHAGPVQPSYSLPDDPAKAFHGERLRPAVGDFDRVADDFDFVGRPR
jgi:hypothetical protein